MRMGKQLDVVSFWRGNLFLRLTLNSHAPRALQTARASVS